MNKVHSTMEFRMHFLLDEKDFIATIMHSKQQFVYASTYIDE